MLSTAFVPPGRILNPKKIVKLQCATAFASSRKFNSRNIENPGYGIWSEMGEDLTADQDCLFVIPQYTLHPFPSRVAHTSADSSNILGDLVTGTASASAAPASAPVPATGVPATDAEESHPGDETFDSTADTVAGENEAIPDFAVICVKYISRRPAVDTPRNLKIVRAIVPLLIEVKRFPSRKLVGYKRMQAINVKIMVAQACVVQQAMAVFRMYAKQTSITLMACSGEYWTHMVLQRESAFVQESLLRDEDEYLPKMGDADSDGESDWEGGDSDDELNFIDNKYDDDEPESDSFLEGVLPEPDVTTWIPPDKFTTMLQLETPASNQRLYMIHAFLKGAVDEVMK